MSDSNNDKAENNPIDKPMDEQIPDSAAEATTAPLDEDDLGGHASGDDKSKK